MSASEDVESEMFTGLLEDALDLAREAVSMSSAILGSTPRMSLNRESEALRWFYFAHEDASVQNSSPLVITPRVYGYSQQAGEGHGVSTSPFSSSVEWHVAFKTNSGEGTLSKWIPPFFYT